jgi:tight adherence protein B
VGVVLSWPASALADGSASIDHVQTEAGDVKLLVSVPGSDQVDLGSVAVTIAGAKAQATAENASSAGDIARTTILAIDTSRSMAGARITEAKKAASAYLDQVPANVKVGIVTFDSTVKERLKPTLDRNAARDVINGLTLSLRTSLYAGVSEAVHALGTNGQRQILLLSDGNDTTGTRISAPIKALKAAQVKLDVVSLQKSDSGNAALNQMSQATGGQVINAQDPSALGAAFASEADVLARQVLVTATVPSTQKASDANVEVTLTAGGQTFTGNAYVKVIPAAKKSTSSKTAAQQPLPLKTGFLIPENIMLGAVAAIGVGLLGVILALSRKSSSATGPVSLAGHINAYGADGAAGTGRRARAQQEGASLPQQARQAAESVLASNRGIEARIAKRLEGAGTSLKPAEWLLLHAVIVVVAGVLGLLLTAGNIVLMLVFVLLGVFVPWVWLGFKKSRRLAAFDSGLADSLQPMSGSLSAGLSLAQSVDTIVREGTEPIASEYRRVIVESRLGVALEDALEGVAARMESRDFQWVVMAIRIQREVGGNLAELLLTVAATLREREYLRRQVKALSAEGRLSCWILGGLPPIFLLYLALTKWSYVNPMFTTPIGWVMLTVLAVLLTVGIFWMSKVSKVDV